MKENNKYKHKIDKKNNSEEDLNLERYIENESKRERELYELIREVFDLRKKLPPIPIFRVRKPPIVKLKFEKLDTSIDPNLLKLLRIKPKTDKKPMKIEWE
ncbi:hypothetical protein LCGC14_0619140 [marine sediment metagenome]|uniref:Uncharacterized protein n=1 Tax=marine sediment metagenome TaxID=412755 RepID=A0A0F9RAD9_9ZZZZ